MSFYYFKFAMHTYVDDLFMSVTGNESLLTLKWKEKTSDLHDEQFKEEAIRFINVVKELQSKKIIVDMRDFQYELGEEVIGRRNEHIISVYNQVGVKRFAFISNKPTVNQNSPKNTFVTQSFLNGDEAVSWINS